MRIWKNKDYINTLNSKDITKKSKTKVKIRGKSCYTMLGASLVGSTTKV